MAITKVTSALTDLDGGITIDNITIDGTEIDLSSGDLTIDVAGDIILDAGDGDVIYHVAGADRGRLTSDSNGFTIRSDLNNGDLIFKGVDGGSEITALTFDMSEAGKATFNSDIVFGGTGTITSATNSLKALNTGDNGFLIRSAVSSAANPSYSNVDDTNTGMFLPGSDVIGFTNGGSERMRIDSSGNVGIGMTPAPVGSDTVLSIFNSATPRIKFHNSSTGSTSSDGGELNMSGTDFIIENREGGNLRFFDNGSERLRINNEGQITTHADSSTIGLALAQSSTGGSDNAIRYERNSTIAHDGDVRFVVFSSGNVQNSNNSYGAISDQTKKENIVDATGKLDELNQVKIRNFNFIGDDQKQIGVIAQELETIFPSMVEDIVDVKTKESIKSVKYSVFVPMLIKAIQEQQTIIEDLKSRIETLEG